MPPRIPPIAAGRRGLGRSLLNAQPYRLSCSLCCLLAWRNRKSHERQRKLTSYPLTTQHRRESTLALESTTDPEERLPNHTSDVLKLKAALIDLQKQFRSFVNPSRLQLALRGLEQRPGEETIRIALLGLSGDGQAPSRIRELVRLLLADPLKEEEEWERTLATVDASRPLLLRVGKHNDDPSTSIVQSRLMQEITISSPTLNAHRLELLVLDMDITIRAIEGHSDIIESMLVPNVEIPTSTTGRYTPITTPIHKVLVLGDGILGAASLVNLPLDANPEIINPAVDIPGYVPGKTQEVPLQITDISLANAALASFRQSLDNALSYERDWFKSGAPELLEWLKAGTNDTADGVMKTSVQALIRSVLEEATRKIQYEESRQLSILLSSRLSSSALTSLREDLKIWAERAHTELRDQLDVAFEGKRWRKLSWWKLFWRVDDVSMITSDILNQRFLPDAEKEVIFLAGEIEQAGVIKAKVVTSSSSSNWAYKEIPEQPPPNSIGSRPAPLRFKDIMDQPQDDGAVSIKPHPWPLHIPTTRAYLSTETVPALQALAQKLVLQSLTTSSFASAFAGLIYISTLSTSLYEAGAVAALGVVWSLRRMQKNWETARSFWEKEVREEGRKAIRSVEGVVGNVLAEPTQGTIEGAEELEQAKQAVERAQKALEMLSNPVGK